MKYSGCGNTFLIFSNDGEWQEKPVSKWCLEADTDGIIVYEALPHRFKMRIFNSDGSEASMCGNGLRCLARFLHDHRIGESPYAIETRAGLLWAMVNEEDVSTAMPLPSSLERGVSLPLFPTPIDFIDTGVPHAVAFVEGVDALNLKEVAPPLRHASYWGKGGANITFAEVTAPSTLKIRTYERGVEGETLSCGTGATAAALTYALNSGVESPIFIETRGGKLTLSFCYEDEAFSDIFLTGPARAI